MPSSDHHHDVHHDDHHDNHHDDHHDDHHDRDHDQIVPDPTDLLAAVGLPLSSPAAPSADEVRRLRAVAGGKEAGDTALRGGRVVAVHTGEIVAADVLLAGRHIAAVVPPGRLDADTDVDVSGQVVAPTFLDAHLHIDYSLLPPGEYARLVVPMGTSGAFADPVCLANVLGLLGLDLTAATRAPFRLFQQVTPDVPRRGGYQLGGASIEQAAIIAIGSAGPTRPASASRTRSSTTGRCTNCSPPRSPSASARPGTPHG